MFLRRRKTLPRFPHRERSLRPFIEQLEGRLVLSSLQIQSAILVDADDTPITAPAIGEEVFIRASWTTTGLLNSDQYTVGFTVDGVTLQSSLIQGQPGTDVPTNTFVGGWFASPGTHSVTVVVDPAHTVIGAGESLTTFPFTFAAVPPSTLPGKLIDPMGSQQSDWTIADYVDVNPLAGQFQDFNGGAFTYDGSTGIDFALGDYAQMDAGYPVVAALGGTVLGVHDGEFDRNTALVNNAANYVEVDDGNGWETLYSGFLANSIAVTVGAPVAPGQVLGLVGGSGNTAGPELQFQVTHDDDIVETNYAPLNYWVTPLPYEGNVPAYVLDSGITNYDSAGDSAERPASETVFALPFNSQAPQVWYWSRISHLNPTDQVSINWFGSTGTLASSTSYTPTGTEDDKFYEWSLDSSIWGSQIGTWQVVLDVNGQAIDSSSFTVQPTVASGAPGLRVTVVSASGTYIVDNRTTPINFGTVAVGSAPPVVTFNLQNIGLAQVNFNNLVLPPNFTRVGSFAGSISAGSTGILSVQLNTNIIGAQFGQLAFSTNVSGESTFAFNIEGNVTGALPSGAPALRPSNAATAYDLRFEPVDVAPAVTLTDSVNSLASAALTVQFVSGATSSDQLAIANQGTGASQISTNNSNVLYGTVAIGTFTGGSNLAPLVVTFNSAATLAIVQALARDITFRTALPLTVEPRYVGMSFRDGLGDGSNTAIKIVDVDSDLAQPNTQVALTATAVSLTYGQTEKLTATVTNPTTGAMPTASVTFEDGGFPVGVVQITNGLAVLTLAGLGAGTDFITAVYSGDTIDTASQASLTLTVAKAHLTVTADNLSKYEGTPNPPLSATITGFVAGDTVAVVTGSATLSTSATTSSVVGVYPILVVGGTLAAANYDFPTLVSGSLSVNSPGPAAVSVALNGSSPTYGQSLTFDTTVAATVSPAATPTGTVQFQVDGANLGTTVPLSVGTAAGAAIAALGAGTYTVTALYSGDSIYPAGSGLLTVVVAKAHLTVAATSLSSTYGSPLPVLTASISGFVNNDTASVVSGAASLSTAATIASPVGSYQIKVNAGTLSAVNYDFPNLESGTLTVSKAQLTVTANAASSTYGGLLPALGATITGFRNGDTSNVISGAASLSTTATASSVVGTYQITAGLGTLVAANYVFATFVGGILTVNKAPLTVTANSASNIYGVPIPPLGVTFGGFVGGDTATVVSGTPVVTTTATVASGVGNYPIMVAVGTLSAANYNFPFLKGGSLSVTKAHLTVTADAVSSAYGSPLPTLTASLSGLVNGDTASAVTGRVLLSTTATPISPVGTYPISVGGGTLSAANYDFPNLVGGTFTVTKAHLTVTASPASSIYGGPVPPLAATITGFVGSDGPGVVTGGPVLGTMVTPASPVGAYPITVGAGTLSAANYDFANLVNGSLTVTQAPLTLTADDQFAFQGSPLPPLTATITGFVNGDTPSVVTGSPVVNTSATPSSPSGTYPISVSVGTLSATNYSFTNLVDGTLTVGAPGRHRSFARLEQPVADLRPVADVHGDRELGQHGRGDSHWIDPVPDKSHRRGIAGPTRRWHGHQPVCRPSPCGLLHDRCVLLR